MSTDYYLDCKTHEHAIYVFDNKGNTFDKLEVKYFILRHGVSGCDIRLESEHTLERNHTYKFKLAMIEHYSECLSIKVDIDYTKEIFEIPDIRKISNKHEELKEIYWQQRQSCFISLIKATPTENLDYEPNNWIFRKGKKYERKQILVMADADKAQRKINALNMAATNGVEFYALMESDT